MTITWKVTQSAGVNHFRVVTALGTGFKIVRQNGEWSVEKYNVSLPVIERWQTWDTIGRVSELQAKIACGLIIEKSSK